MNFKIRITQKHIAGAAIGLIFPIIMVPVTVFILSSLQHYSFSVLWERLFHDQMILSKTLSLSIIPNLIWFYIFLNRERYEIAKGIIVGSALHLPFIVYVNLIR